VAGKRLDLLHEVVPDLRHLVIMANVANPQAALEMGEIQAAARRLSLEITPLAIRRAEDIAAGFAALKLKAGALYVVQDVLVVASHTNNNLRTQQRATDDH
ncbi:MAG: ABC transporter substrate binding protein, partial [Pseudolabrys sp.]